MRIVSWNCCKGPPAKKLLLLEPFQADITVIQECGKPAAESDHCLWFGDNPRQGVLILAAPGFSLKKLPTIDGIPKFVVPIGVSGPDGKFTLYAVWSKKNAFHPYVEGVVRAVDLYREQISAGPSVVMGDFNSNAIWDREHPEGTNHSALVMLLSSLGLVSAYHHFFDEEPGMESKPTFYFHWNETKPFHIDYCFLPLAWSKQITSVHVGSYADWNMSSDHRPLAVDVGMQGFESGN